MVNNMWQNPTSAISNVSNEAIRLIILFRIYINITQQLSKK